MRQKCSWIDGRFLGLRCKDTRLGFGGIKRILIGIFVDPDLGARTCAFGQSVRIEPLGTVKAGSGDPPISDDVVFAGDRFFAGPTRGLIICEARLYLNSQLRVDTDDTTKVWFVDTASGLGLKARDLGGLDKFLRSQEMFSLQEYTSRTAHQTVSPV